MKTYTKDSIIVATRQDLVDTVLEQNALIDKLTNDKTQLTMQLEWFNRQVFGAKSERYIPADEQQMALELGVLDHSAPESDVPRTEVSFTRKGTSEAKKPIIGHGRGSMPTHLPVKEIVVEPEGNVDGLKKIGDEVSWYFEMDTPSQLHIVKTIRPKYALPEKNGVVIGRLPELPVDKGNAGPGLMAHITNEKFLYAMPLDRQRKKFKNEYNVDFSESWLSDIVKKAVFWYEPIYNAHKDLLLSSTYIQADETPIPVLTTDGKGKTHRGYFWVYHDPIQKIVIFDYRKSRSREGPNSFLKEYKGTLQVDGYEGYAEIIRQNELTYAACMDHVRRRFDKALAYDAVRAKHALDTMQVWYAYEQDARQQGVSFDTRYAMRQKNVAPSMVTFKAWMLQEIANVLPKSPIGIALSYAVNQWPFFNAYLTDGRVELSNILIENAIRPVALGRKNFLFAGSHDAATRAAIIYSLTATAKWHDIEPFDYFKELLTEQPKSKAKDIHTFLLTNKNCLYISAR